MWIPGIGNVCLVIISLTLTLQPPQSHNLKPLNNLNTTPPLYISSCFFVLDKPSYSRYSVCIPHKRWRVYGRSQGSWISSNNHCCSSSVLFISKLLPTNQNHLKASDLTSKLGIHVSRDMVRVTNNDHIPVLTGGMIYYSVGDPCVICTAYAVFVLDSDFRSCGFYFLISGNTKPQSDEVRRVF